jgi:chemotaxis protein methyltransferase CheR
MEERGDFQEPDGLVRPLSRSEFDEIRRLAYDKFGLNLRDGKEELVAARLGKMIREAGFHSFRQYHRHVVADASGEALVAMIDALTTNHTSFLREPEHFRFLAAQILPQLGSRRPIEIWCAACATGEEAYSIAFSLAEAQVPRAAIQILATDISTRALAGAERGVYPAERFTGFPPGWLPRYFLRGQGEWEGWFRIKPFVREVIQFRRLNLVETWPHTRSFPVIFCRNVMIYFDRPVQTRLVSRLAERLEPGGYLLTGHAESLSGVDHPLRYVCPAIYRKPETRGRP